jgi:Right handed beta helix region
VWCFGSTAKRTARAVVRVFLSTSLVSAAGCGDEQQSLVPADRSEPSTDFFDPNQFPPPDELKIDSPALPDCLAAESPPGCTALPNLPTCLQGDPPLGCAAAPGLTDWTCPSAWDPEQVPAYAQNSTTVCNVDEPPTCADAQAAFVSETSCTPLGTACPVSDFLEESIVRARAGGLNGDILYVRPNASGNGSSADPFGSLKEAIAAASSGDIIALSKGAFPTSVEIDRDVAIVGACVSKSSLVFDPAQSSPAVLNSATSWSRIANVSIIGGEVGVETSNFSGDLELSEVEIRDANSAGIRRSNNGSTRVDRVVIRGDETIAPRGQGVLVTSGAFEGTHLLVERMEAKGLRFEGPTVQVDLKDVVVRDTRAGSSEGQAVAVLGGAVATLERLAAFRNRKAGLFVRDDGSSLQVQNGLIRETNGYGIRLELGAFAHLVQVAFDQNRVTAVDASGAATQVTLESVLIRDTKSSATTNTLGDAVWLRKGASAQIENSVLSGNHEAGIVAYDDGTTVLVRDTVVRDTQGQASNAAYGEGVWLASGASAELERCWLEGNHETGVRLTGSGTAANLVDVTVASTLPDDLNNWLGVGLIADGGSRAHLERVTLSGNHTAGLIAFGPGTSVEVLDTLVQDTLEQPSGELHGVGLDAYDHASLSVERTALVNNGSAGLMVRDGAQLDSTDLVVSGTHADSTDKAGVGVMLQSGALANVARLRATGNTSAGLYATGGATTLHGTDVTIERTKGRVTDQAGGVGLQVEAGAEAELERATLDENHAAAIHVLGADSLLTLRQGLVQNTLPQVSDKSFGYGAYVRAGTLVAASCVFRNNVVAGIGVLELGHVELTDTVVSDTQSQRTDLRPGYGLWTGEGASMNGERVRLERNHFAGLMAESPDSLAWFRHLLIVDTLDAECEALDLTDPRACADDVENLGPGVGAVSADHAIMDLGMFETRGATCGLWIASSSTLRADNGLVHGNTIGLNVRVEDYDLTTVLGPRVRYYDNESNLESINLPIPPTPPQFNP